MSRAPVRARLTHDEKHEYWFGEENWDEELADAAADKAWRVRGEEAKEAAAGLVWLVTMIADGRKPNDFSPVGVAKALADWYSKFPEEEHDAGTD